MCEESKSHSSCSCDPPGIVFLYSFFNLSIVTTPANAPLMTGHKIHKTVRKDTVGGQH